MEEGRAGRWSNIHMTLEVKMIIVKGPVGEGRVRKEQ